MVHGRTLKLCIMVLAILLPRPAISEVLLATETGRGEYEDGVFSAGAPEFGYRFEIDEPTKKVTLTESVRLNDGSIVEEGTEYVITSIDDGTSVSAVLLFTEKRRGERVLTIVGKPGSLATEVIMLGETFFEYCKASAGRLYLATGTVRRAISGEEEIQRRLLQPLPR